jgi:RNA polymerase sigma-70 factor (ECF subfamily)
MRSDNQQQNRFFELLEPELERLQAFCRRLTGAADSGEDLLQDSLYDAWRGFRQLRKEQAFRAWLYQTTVNRYRTSLRKFRKRADATLPLTEDIVDGTQLRLQAARDRLNYAMAGLSAADRALVTLHEIEGWSYAELAAMSGCSEGSLRTRLTRCRRRMRQRLTRELKKTDDTSFKTGVLGRWIATKQERN